MTKETISLKNSLLRQFEGRKTSLFCGIDEALQKSGGRDGNLWLQQFSLQRKREVLWFFLPLCQ